MQHLQCLSWSAHRTHWPSRVAARCPPVPPGSARAISIPAYARTENRQHLGVDFTVGAGGNVYAPVEGDVVVNRTSASDVMQAYLVIRSPQGSEHVLGHISSSLRVGAHVAAGQTVGTVRAWPGQPSRSHVHWGVNRTGVSQAMSGDWGWGRAPVTATRADASRRGWVRP